MPIENVLSREPFFQRGCPNRKDGCKFTYNPTPEGQRDLEDHLREDCAFSSLAKCTVCELYIPVQDLQVRDV